LTILRLPLEIPRGYCGRVALRLTLRTIDDAGLAELSEALRASSTQALLVNCSLTSLELDHNKIGNVGTQVLGDALRINDSLFTLALGGNYIDDAGAQALGEALGANGGLYVLDLESNYIGDAGAQALGDAVRVNSSLAKLVF
jgi:Ran GTPase-activating protein (RanGAP) involved in mRNA processing and transport